MKMVSEQDQQQQLLRLHRQQMQFEQQKFEVDKQLAMQTQQLSELKLGEAQATSAELKKARGAFIDRRLGVNAGLVATLKKAGQPQVAAEYEAMPAMNETDFANADKIVQSLSNISKSGADVAKSSFEQAKAGLDLENLDTTTTLGLRVARAMAQKEEGDAAQSKAYQDVVDAHSLLAVYGNAADKQLAIALLPLVHQRAFQGSNTPIDSQAVERAMVRAEKLRPIQADAMERKAKGLPAIPPKSEAIGGGIDNKPPRQVTEQLQGSTFEETGRELFKLDSADTGNIVMSDLQPLLDKRKEGKTSLTGTETTILKNVTSLLKTADDRLAANITPGKPSLLGDITRKTTGLIKGTFGGEYGEDPPTITYTPSLVKSWIQLNKDWQDPNSTVANTAMLRSIAADTTDPTKTRSERRKLYQVGIAEARRRDIEFTPLESEKLKELTHLLEVYVYPTSTRY
jgi:hypothetical protein